MLGTGTNPTLWDTDGGGTSDGDEVTDGTDPHDPGDDISCVFTTLDVYDFTAPVGGPISPDSVQIDVRGAFHYDDLLDFRIDANGDGLTDLASATVTFRLRSGGAALCKVEYDGSDLLPNYDPWTVAGAGSVAHMWSFGLHDGDSTCPALDAGVWGSNDVRDVIASRTWAFGLGTLTDLADELEALAGPAWAADVEPFAGGWYISTDGATVAEHGSATAYERACDLVTFVGGELVPHPSPAGDWPSSYIEGAGIVDLPFEPDVIPPPPPPMAGGAVYDNCADVGADVYGFGFYQFTGDLSTAANDLDVAIPGPPCTGATSSGEEVVFPFTFGPNDQMVMLMGAGAGGNPSIYVLEDCVDTATCVFGADGALNPEGIIIYNDRGTDVTWTAVADCRVAGCTSYTLDIRVSDSTSPPDSCADSLAATLYETGDYFLAGNLIAFSNDVNMGAANPCTGFETGGDDAFFPVLLQNGETLDVAYTNWFGDASLYIFSDCALFTSCEAGADATLIGDEERVGYVNTTGAPQLVHVGVDCYDAAQCWDYALEMHIY